ncbi:hypothetical protein LOD99_8500 [Oopsacas minuta]|uniref:Uncharacterized protein n=1 Tax=Oopsacas minuta TaxID=111878 RepID=A0AAV7JG92_9METZ|nr:hypothetical protein LOD99_8500 [Oopsacas minuta]
MNNPNTQIQSVSIPDPIIPHSQNIFTNESDSDSDHSNSVFEATLVPPREDCSSSITSPPTIPRASSDSTSLQIIDMEKLTAEFHTFMITNGGGGRRNTPVKGDISSFRCFAKEVWWGNFWNHNVLNDYITSATCSPSTSYGRLRVYEKVHPFLAFAIP